MRGNSISASNINKYLDVLQIVRAQIELISEKIPITAESLKDKLLGTEIKKRMLIPIFEDHNNKIRALIDREYSSGTLERYQTSKHTRELLKWKYKSSDTDIKEIDHVFITEYGFWLRSVRKCANNTAMKYIKNFKKNILLCIVNGWLDQAPFVSCKAKLNQVEKPYLNEIEIQTIYDKPLAEELIMKYENNPKCVNNNILLPVLSNQKMNSYLKEIADVCELIKI